MKGNSGRVIPYAGLIFCLVLFTILPPFYGQNLWSLGKLQTLMADVIVTALMSVGAVFVYALGYIDISIGSQIRLLCNANGFYREFNQVLCFMEL